MTGILSKVRERSPLVHCITNPVTINDCANALLAIGASPVMSTHPEETADVTGHADALVINLGHITTPEAVMHSVSAAAAKGIPFVIDPVGVGVSGYRRRQFLSIVKEASPAVIRGNASEIRTLLSLVRHPSGNDLSGEKGVDVSSEDKITPETLSVWTARAMELSAALSCVTVISGAIDVVADAEHFSTISGGSSMLRCITGSGCMLSSICGAAAASYEDHFTAAKLSVILMNMAGETAEKKTAGENGGPGTFHIKLMDALGGML